MKRSHLHVTWLYSPELSAAVVISADQASKHPSIDYVDMFRSKALHMRLAVDSFWGVGSGLSSFLGVATTGRFPMFQ